jgi:hypothetical protein
MLGDLILNAISNQVIKKFWNWSSVLQETE